MIYGPGIFNLDAALHKNKTTKIAEAKTLEIRFETFNTANHAQFYGSTAVDGNIDSPTSTAPPSGASSAPLRPA